MNQELTKYEHQYEGKTISFELITDAIRVERNNNFIDPSEDYDYLEKLKQNGIRPPLNENARAEVHLYRLDASKREAQINFLHTSEKVKRVRSIYKSGNDIFFGTGELIVIPKSEMTKIAVEHLTSGKVIDSIKGVFLVDFGTDALADENYRLLVENPQIKHIEKNFSTLEERRSESTLGNSMNPLYTQPLPEQRAYDMTETFKTHETFYVCKEFREACSKIKIALLDSGVDVGHPDLKSTVDVEGCWDFVKKRKNQMPNDYDFHGTLCAGMLTARRSHDIGVDGVAKGCTLISYRIGLGDSRRGFEINLFLIIKAILRAGLEEKVDVINCSWTFKKEFSTLKFAISELVRKGRDGKGTIIVFSAGNDGKPTKFPGNLKEVITVSAVNEDKHPVKISDRSPWGSSFGNEVDIAAPGTNLVTTDIRDHLGRVGGWSNHDDYYKHFGGTSGAAPQVAGCAALMLARNQDLTWDELKIKLIDTTEIFPEPREKENYGSGILNVYNAVSSALE
ncbi:S8 family peptidase [Spongiimicrobium salis]|uniref:S8 family peptidase n=1 Tax=Spongiimicrobium salis TaxID=1667022 RepID=UPI00374CA6AA